jgi:hypothetical protein
MKVWWLYDLDDYVYQSLTPFSYFYLSQPQPSVPRSYNVILYFFMQSGQRLRPNAISVLQKAHATLAPFISVRSDVSNKNDWAGWLLNLVGSLPLDFSLLALRSIRESHFLWQRRSLFLSKKKRGNGYSPNHVVVFCCHIRSDGGIAKGVKEEKATTSLSRLY